LKKDGKTLLRKEMGKRGRENAPGEKKIIASTRRRKGGRGNTRHPQEKKSYFCGREIPQGLASLEKKKILYFSSKGRKGVKRKGGRVISSNSLAERKFRFGGPSLTKRVYRGGGGKKNSKYILEKDPTYKKNVSGGYGLLNPVSKERGGKATTSYVFLRERKNS